MYQLFCSSALLTLLLLGVSANYLREVSQQQRTDSVQFKNQKNDYFPEPPYCGVGKSSKAPNRIYGGTEVEEGEFPWMVYFSPMVCGGTLINSRWVLSAAHCFHRRNHKSIKAYLGTLKSTNYDAEFAIEAIFNHEQYTAQLYSNDIALVQLRRSVNFNNKIQPICLPYDDQAGDSSIVGQDAVISGWGKTEYGRTNDLLKTTVKIWNADKCAKHLRGGEYDDIASVETYDFTREHYICAGGIKGVDACSGDSGGPLFMQLHSSENDDISFYYQVGVTNFGPDPCAIKGKAGVYANVSTHIPWIRKTILAKEQNQMFI